MQWVNCIFEVILSWIWCFEFIHIPYSVLIGQQSLIRNVSCVVKVCEVEIVMGAVINIYKKCLLYLGAFLTKNNFIKKKFGVTNKYYYL